MTNDQNSQMAIPLAVDPKASFDNFWVGHNYEAVSALKDCVQRAEQKVLYLYGPPSCGKTHLLFATMRLAKEDVRKTSYLSLSDQYVPPMMLDTLDPAHLVLLDDLHAWAGDRELERAVFALFEQIKSAGGQLVVTAQTPPREQGFVIPDLVSRLSSGLLYPLEPLMDAQQFEALKLRATLKGLQISDEALKYLCSRSSRDPAELFAVLDKIDQASLVEQRRVTIPFLQKLLKPQA